MQVNEFLILILVMCLYLNVELNIVRIELAHSAFNKLSEEVASR